MIAIRYAAGSPDCRLDVAVPVLVVEHMAVATLILRTCMERDYSPDQKESQGEANRLQTRVTATRANKRQISCRNSIAFNSDAGR